MLGSSCKFASGHKQYLITSWEVPEDQYWVFACSSIQDFTWFQSSALHACAVQLSEGCWTSDGNTWKQTAVNGISWLLAVPCYVEGRW